MKIEQRVISSSGESPVSPVPPGTLHPQLVLASGPRDLLEDPQTFSRLRALYPDSRLVLVSSSGAISGAEIFDTPLSVTAIAFEKTTVAIASIHIMEREESYSAGEKLATQLIAPDLVHIFVFADGQLSNGSQLALAFNRNLPPGVTVSGGLAGDGTRFQKTLIGLDDLPSSGRIVAIGLYSRHLTVGFGCGRGWVPFGLERTVTRSEGPVLHQLDDQSALQLYKNYLGSESAALPLSGLRFPLLMTPRDGGATVVRTPHAIDETNGSMSFAGDIPAHAQVRFLRASYDELIRGAGDAAAHALRAGPPELALCVSCVARRVILGQRTEEELENIRDTVGPGTVLAGFYSYGELAPSDGRTDCQFHNQTMTITTLREV